MTEQSIVDWDSNRRNRFRQNVKRWYARHARRLPWRESHDPFAIWISEIMLQQTTVAAVIPYFARFTKRFPTLELLADAGEDEVLQLWEGLGYYSRARNIHKTARILQKQYAGQFPQQVDLLMALPGIGRYTAGAIASFAFGQRAPIVEANTQRLFSRLIGCEDELASNSARQKLWSFAENILPRSDPGGFNQAMMELGSQICTPKEPLCNLCPAKSCCQAFLENKQRIIPKPKAVSRVIELTEACVAIRKSSRYLLRKRQADERWSGLWDFPRFSHPTSNSSQNRDILPRSAYKQLKGELQNLTGIQSHPWQLVSHFHHTITRYKIHLFCYESEYRSGRLHQKSGFRWFAQHEISNLAMSAPGRKFANRLTNAS